MEVIFLQAVLFSPSIKLWLRMDAILYDFDLPLDASSAP